MYVEDAMGAITCPIVRQMLGATTQNSGLYHGNGRKTSISQHIFSARHYLQCDAVWRTVGWSTVYMADWIAPFSGSHS